MMADAALVRIGAGGDLLVYHSSNENIIQANTSDQDLLFKGKDGASAPSQPSPLICQRQVRLRLMRAQLLAVQ